MDEQQLRQLLQRLVADVERRADCELVLTPKDAQARRYRLEIPSSRHRTQKVFSYPKIRPQKGCLVLTLWEKNLKHADKGRIPHWQFRENYMFGQDGRRLEYCREEEVVYEEAVYALVVACKSCLQS